MSVVPAFILLARDQRDFLSLTPNIRYPDDVFFRESPSSGRSKSQVNGLAVLKQNRSKKTRRAAAMMSKTDEMRRKIKQLRQNFKVLDETKPKKEKCRRKGKGKSCKGRQTGKRFKGAKKKKKKTRYYLENGKYKRNKKFDSWADEVTKMWKKVNILNDVIMFLLSSELLFLLPKVKRDSSCSCGVSSVERTRIVNGAEAEVESCKTFA